MSICFVAMPFGKKKDAGGREIDFNSIYEDVIAPAIRDARLTPYRADEELRGGIIHQPMYEALLLCDFVVADLTTANPNVFYELGIRHAMKPYATVLMQGGGVQLPFDVAPLRTITYELTANGQVADPAKLHDMIRKFLETAVSDVRTKVDPPPDPDSPLFQLIKTYPVIPHDRAEIFRNAARSDALKMKLRAARKSVAGLKEFEAGIEDLAEVEAAIAIDLMLAYRDAKGFEEMIALVDRFPAPLKATTLVREQLALALNRAGRGEEAEAILKKILEERGANPETYGLLGRVHKDRWSLAVEAGDDVLAPAQLEEAIAAYLTGFEADWRDAYPGINAVTLLSTKCEGDPRLDEILPVVRYSVRRKIARGKPDYWDYATLLELAAHAEDETDGKQAFGKMLTTAPAPMMADTTKKNLKMIVDSRALCGKPALAWLDPIIERLMKIAGT
jgi:tetratricopeptide (TPR) repeat protein